MNSEGLVRVYASSGSLVVVLALVLVLVMSGPMLVRT